MTPLTIILACAVCYGDSNSGQTHGMNMAIMTMLGVTGLVLSGFGAVFAQFARRARHTQSKGTNDAN